jgi:hypothetical protein
MIMNLVKVYTCFFGIRINMQKNIPAIIGNFLVRAVNFIKMKITRL